MTMGGLKNGEIMLEGAMGVYKYTPYIKNVGEGRTILFECNRRYFLKGSNFVRQ